MKTPAMAMTFSNCISLGAGLAAAAFALSACRGAPTWADAPPAPERVQIGAFSFATPRAAVWRETVTEPRDGVTERRFEGRADTAAVYVSARLAGPFAAIGNTDDLIADLSFAETLQPYRTSQPAQFRPASRGAAVCAEARDEGPLAANAAMGVTQAPAATAFRIRITCVDPASPTTRAEFAAWTLSQGGAIAAAQRAAVEAAAAGFAYQGGR